MKGLKYYFVLLVVFACWLKPLPSFAWGAEGHRITATVAYANIDQAVKDSLKSYLGKTSLEDASTWMDEIRSDPKYDALKPFHYINLDKGEKYNPDSLHNIIGELKEVIARLKERQKYSREQVAMDIKILTHLMGDLHQPLHVGYGSDEGGNMVLLTYISWNSNLHKVWDTEIIEQNNVSGKHVVKLAAKLTPEEKEKIESGSFVRWMNDSRSHLVQAYAFKNSKIDFDYALKNQEVIERQLAIGGLRLAHVLEEIFGSK